jgi:hypothetical protein
MTDPVDQMLARLATAPVHPRLRFTERAILDRAEQPAVPLFSLGAFSMGLAVAMGIGSAAFAMPAEASPLSSLAQVEALAPSNLLVGAR